MVRQTRYSYWNDTQEGDRILRRFAGVLRKHLAAQDVDQSIDFGCALEAGAFDTDRAPVTEGRTLLDISVSVSDRTLSYFIMSLLHHLQQLGTLGAIDYEAYAGPLTYDV